MMNCSTFRRHLNETEHGRGVFVLPPALQTHLDGCEDCQRAWQAHSFIMRELENEAAPSPSPQFTARIMAKLPSQAPRARQSNIETLVLIAAVAAGLVTTWFVSEGLRQSILAFITEGKWLETAKNMLEATLWTWQRTLMNTFGEQVLKQGLQVLLITSVTAVVSKAAVVLEQRLRRMLRSL